MALDTESLGSLRIDRTTVTSGGNRTGLYATIAVVVVVLAAGAWFYLRPKPTEITTVVAEAESSGPSLGTSVLNASGYVVARRMATVSSKVTGKVLEIYVEEGMEVKKDQVLARLDPVNSSTILTMAERELAAARSNLTEIEVRLTEARRNLERNEAQIRTAGDDEAKRHLVEAQSHR